MRVYMQCRVMTLGKETTFKAFGFEIDAPVALTNSFSRVFYYLNYGAADLNQWPLLVKRWERFWGQSGVWVPGWEMNCVSASLRLDFRSKWRHCLSMMDPPSVTTFKHTQETQQTSMLASWFSPWFFFFWCSVLLTLLQRLTLYSLHLLIK